MWNIKEQLKLHLSFCVVKGFPLVLITCSLEEIYFSAVQDNRDNED